MLWARQIFFITRGVGKISLLLQNHKQHEVISGDMRLPIQVTNFLLTNILFTQFYAHHGILSDQMTCKRESLPSQQHEFLLFNMNNVTNLRIQAEFCMAI